MMEVCRCLQSLHAVGWWQLTRQTGKQHLGAVAALSYETLGTPLFHVLFSKGVTLGDTTY